MRRARVKILKYFGNYSFRQFVLLGSNFHNVELDILIYYFNIFYYFILIYFNSFDSYISHKNELHNLNLKAAKMEAEKRQIKWRVRSQIFQINYFINFFKYYNSYLIHFLQCHELKKLILELENPKAKRPTAKAENRTVAIFYSKPKILKITSKYSI